MSIAFNRRTFLKTGAALLGAAALVGLTGCDSSSSSSSHPINKVVGKDQTFDVGGVRVEFGSRTFRSDEPYCRVDFHFTYPTEAYDSATLYSSNFSAAYDGTILNCVGLEFNGQDVTRADFTKNDGEVTVTVKFDGFPTQLKPADYAKFAYKFHYGNQSIKFSDNGTNTLTSGVYNDPIKL